MAKETNGCKCVALQPRISCPVTCNTAPCQLMEPVCWFVTRVGPFLIPVTAGRTVTGATQRSTPTPLPSLQPNSTPARRTRMTGKTLPRHPPGQLRWHDADHSLATQKGPRRSRAHYRAEMPVTGHQRCCTVADQQFDRGQPGSEEPSAGRVPVEVTVTRLRESEIVVGVACMFRALRAA
jgi:hypothetical protein